MIFGAIAMFSCIGYMAYMRHNSDNTNHYPAVTSDGSINLKKNHQSGQCNLLHFI